jgi:hypothetical protein
MGLSTLCGSRRISVSHSEKLEAQCPSCRRFQTPLVWASVTADFDPHLKMKILNNDINAIQCGCGRQLEIPQNLLYNDIRQRFRVWLRYPDAQGKIDLEETIPATEKVFKLGCRLRIVTSRMELIDKIRVFDAMLDDEAIEMVKLNILTWKFGGGVEDPDNSAFLVEFRKPSTLTFIVFGKGIAAPVHVYADLKDVYAQFLEFRSKYRLPVLAPNDTWMQVNRNFAIQMLMAMQAASNNTT